MTFYYVGLIVATVVEETFYDSVRRKGTIKGNSAEQSTERTYLPHFILVIKSLTNDVLQISFHPFHYA
jgi:hypothetical protein